MARPDLVAGLVRAGVMVLDSDLSLEPELALVLEDSIGVHISRVAYPGEVSPEGLAEAADHVVDAARLLLPAKPGLLVYACTSGSFYEGIEGNGAIEERISEQAQVPSATASTAVLWSLHRIGASRVHVVSPYSAAVTERLVEFLTASGKEVTGVSLLFNGQIVDDVTLQSASQEDFSAAIRDAAPIDADAVLISCTGMRGIRDLAELEELAERPVITSNAAICRLLMDYAAVGPRQFGMLLSLDPVPLALDASAR